MPDDAAVPTIRTDGYELVDTATLEPHPRNVNEGDIGAITESMDELGFYGAVIAQRTTRRILAGKHRWMTAQLRGMEQVPVLWVDVDDEEALRIMLSDNRTARLGRDDPEALATLLGELTDSERALAGTGFDGDDLDALLRDLDADNPRAGNDDAPDLDTETPPITQPGDVWLLGAHRLVCGDARVALPAVMRDDLADIVWTDPPYGIGYTGVDTTPRAPMSGDDVAVDELLVPALEATDAVMRHGAPFYVCAPPGPALEAFMRAVRERWSLRQVLIWAKDRFVLGHSDYHVAHEPILYGYKPGAGRLGRGSEGWFGDDAADTVFSVARPARSESHPTMKPIALIEPHLRNSSRSGAIVLDPFGGSGSTMVAAQATGRRARLVELDPAYCDVIVRRWEGLTGATATREAG